MSELTFRRDFWDDDQAREAFKRFLINVHGLDLSWWQDAGYWDHAAYHPFSYFDDTGEVVSSLCVYSTDLIVDGRECPTAQLSGVGTLVDHRRRGLNQRLTEIALKWAEDSHDFTFLFADERALAFYASCGFHELSEARPIQVVDGREPAPGLRRLDASKPKDRSLIETAAFHRVPVSRRLGALSPRLFLFHVLYGYRDFLYALPELDLILLMQQEGERLVLIDVVGQQMPSFERLLPYIRNPHTREIAFGFCPDLLEPPDLEWRPFPDNHLHDRGDFPLSGQQFILPVTAHA